MNTGKEGGGRRPLSLQGCKLLQVSERSEKKRKGKATSTWRSKFPFVSWDRFRSFSIFAKNSNQKKRKRRRKMSEICKKPERNRVVDVPRN